MAIPSAIMAITSAIKNIVVIPSATKIKTLAVILISHLQYGYYIRQNVVIPSATVVITSATNM